MALGVHGRRLPPRVVYSADWPRLEGLGQRAAQIGAQHGTIGGKDHASKHQVLRQATLLDLHQQRLRQWTPALGRQKQKVEQEVLPLRAAATKDQKRTPNRAPFVAPLAQIVGLSYNPNVGQS